MFGNKNIYLQVAYADLVRHLGLIGLFRCNCEIFVTEEVLGAYTDNEIDRINAVFIKRDIDKTVHGPIALSALSRRDAHHQTVIFCRKLKARHLVTHAEYSPRKFLSVEGWLKEESPLWKDIAGYAEREGITVLLENHTEQDPEAIVRLLKEVGSEHLQACFDVGHFHAFGDRAPADFLDRYPAGSIREVHVSDNRKDGDTHLALGRGNLDFKTFFGAVRSRGITGPFVIEAKNALDGIAGYYYLYRNAFV